MNSRPRGPVEAGDDDDDEEEEDCAPQHTSIGQRNEIVQRAPLLTGIEAPSVTVASTDFDLDAEHLLDISRPKSGMRSAFMNMANSIMYVYHPSVQFGIVDHNSLLIYGSLKKPTMDRFARVTHFSTFISMVACLAMALTGFLTFGDKTQGNVLNNFPTDNIVVNIARL
ncbi:MAG: hypothetical protein Q9221_004898 [Calogaya cf. arnoldii]